MQPGIERAGPDHGARAPRSTRSGATEVARGRARDRRVPAHAERQDPEVRAAPTPAGRSPTRVSESSEARGGTPLSDVRVIDVSRFVAGPLATFFLASMGAEVIAIEPPTPSTSRRMSPFAGPEGGARGDYVDGALSVPFLKRGRGKRSVALDIQRPEGQDLVRRLVARADVFIENSRPGTMHEFGLGHEELRRADPRLITCAISGYGQHDHERPAMDVIVQAASGAMAKTGFADGPPLRSGITIADHTTATFAALGIVAALRQRDVTGRGSAGRRRDARRAHRARVRRARRPLRRDRYSGAHRQRRRARRADQLVPLRGRLGCRHVHERGAVRAPVHADGSTGPARAVPRRPGTRAWCA